MPAKPSPRPTTTARPTIVPLDQDVSTGVISASLSNGDYIAAYDFNFNSTTLSPTYYASILVWLSNPISSSTLLQAPGTPPVRATMTLPSASASSVLGVSQSLCTLCSVLSSDKANGVPTACLPETPRLCLHSSPLPGRSSMRLEIRLADYHFNAEFRLRSTPAAFDDWETLSLEPTPAPSFTHYSEASSISLNQTSISVWFFVVVTFVCLCAWRVYRQHRINLLLAGAGGRAGGDEECPPGMLRVREIALSPVHAAAFARAQGAAEPYPLYPSAEARVVGDGQEDGPAPSLTTAHAVAVAADGPTEHSSRRL